MPIVDTHCHAGLHKYEPIESLLFHMEQTGVDKGVLIQHMGNYDNAYHADCLKRYPGRFASAMLVEEEDDGTHMRRWAELGLSGIRLRPAARALNSDQLVQWRTAAELGLVVSSLCRPAELLSDEFAEVLATFPDLQIVIEHLGGIGHGAQPPYAEFKQLLKLAERPNLYIKLPGFGEFCDLPHPFSSIPPFAQMAIEAFGPERVMWGSDFPPVSSREGYDNALRFPMEYLADLSREEREWIFGRTALKVWKLEAA